MSLAIAAADRNLSVFVKRKEKKNKKVKKNKRKKLSRQNSDNDEELA